MFDDLVGQWQRAIAAARVLFPSTVLVVSLIALQGCAAIGLTLLGVGAGTAAGIGTGHALRQHHLQDLHRARR